MVQRLQRYKPRLHYHPVRWKLPDVGWVKCNTDGASRGNPGESAYGFCIRDNQGNLIYVATRPKGITTKMEVKTMGMLNGLRECKHRIL